MNLKQKQDFLDKFDTFLLDCDGVLWHADTVLPQVKETLEALRKANKRIVFVSNNSTKSRASYKAKFDKLGIQADIDEIFGSAYATAAYFTNILNWSSNRKVYVCGMKGIQDELEAEGVEWIGGEEETNDVNELSLIETVKSDPCVGAVVFGFDINYSYTKLAKAFTYLQDVNCHFIATNDDLTFPAGGTVYPGTGSMLQSLVAPLKRQPTIIGKPHQTMLDVIVAKHHLNKATTCMVGDRLDTDIQFGQKGGLATLLVLSGVTTKQDLVHSTIKPDYCLDCFGDLFEAFLI